MSGTAFQVTLYLIALLTILLHLAFAGGRVTRGIMLVQSVDVPRHATALKPGERKRLKDLLQVPGPRRVFSVSGQLSIMFGALGAALGMAPVFWTMALALIGGAWYSRRGG